MYLCVSTCVYAHVCITSILSMYLDFFAHIEVQTELYLEEITDRVEEADIQTQTDAFLDRPPTPLFVPAKTGMDASTQIEEGDVSCHAA